jgi:hypothetical protein
MGKWFWHLWYKVQTSAIWFHDLRFVAVVGVILLCLHNVNDLLRNQRGVSYESKLIPISI